MEIHLAADAMQHYVDLSNDLKQTKQDGIFSQVLGLFRDKKKK